MKLFDLHLHSNFSFDSVEDSEEIVRSAIAKNVEVMGFTDHYDIFLGDKEPCMYNLNDYFKEIDRLRDKYSSQIKILRGIEIGLNLNFKGFIDKLIELYPFDYVIGSIHGIYEDDIFENRDKIEKNPHFWLNKYYDYILECLNSFDNFNILGHLDYIDRYIDFKYDPYDYLDRVEEIFKLLIKKNIALEINTGGLRKGLNFPHPKKVFLDRYFDLGGRFLTLGSDAHRASDVACDFDFALKYISEYPRELIYFERGKMIK